jgi:hypothetical protein
MGFAQDIKMKKISIIDLAVGIVVFGLIVIAVFGYFKPKNGEQKDIYVKSRVYINAEDVRSEVKAQVGKEVYFNGTKDAVTLVSVDEKEGNIFLVIRGGGEVKDNRYILNGTSVASGQRAEIHSNFKAKTIITDVQNEPFKSN